MFPLGTVLADGDTRQQPILPHEYGINGTRSLTPSLTDVRHASEGTCGALALGYRTAGEHVGVRSTYGACSGRWAPRSLGRSDSVRPRSGSSVSSAPEGGVGEDLGNSGSATILRRRPLMFGRDRLEKRDGQEYARKSALFGKGNRADLPSRDGKESDRFRNIS